MLSSLITGWSGRLEERVDIAGCSDVLQTRRGICSSSCWQWRGEDCIYLIRRPESSFITYTAHLSFYFLCFHSSFNSHIVVLLLAFFTKNIHFGRIVLSAREPLVHIYFNSLQRSHCRALNLAWDGSSITVNKAKAMLLLCDNAVESRGWFWKPSLLACGQGHTKSDIYWKTWPFKKKKRNAAHMRYEKRALDNVWKYNVNLVTHWKDWWFH